MHICTKKNTEHFEFFPMQLAVWIAIYVTVSLFVIIYFALHIHLNVCFFWFWGSSDWSKADGDLYQRIYCFDRFFSQRVHDQLWNEIRWIRIENATDRGIIANSRSKGTQNIHFFMLNIETNRNCNDVCILDGFDSRCSIKSTIEW